LSLRCEKSVDFSLVFASEVKQKLNEVKIKRKRSENFKAKKDKVSGTICKETKKNIMVGLLVFQVCT
jgi:hypothetical protein